jgi:CHAT domain-containing protein
MLESCSLIYIIPDESLFNLSFASLVTNYNTDIKFLIEKCSIVFLPSSSFLRKKSDPISYSDHNILISGNIEFPGVEIMIKHIKKSFQSRKLINANEKSTINSIIQQITQGNEGFIFIGHGKSNYKYPELSSLEVASIDKNTAKQEISKVYMKDLIHAGKSTLNLAILIGCETASGKVYRSTGLSGIHQGFLILGTENVVGTLWEIDLSHSLGQLKELVNALSKNIEPARAMQKFQVKTIKKLRKDKYFLHPHPYFWGGYILFSIRQ